MGILKTNDSEWERSQTPPRRFRPWQIPPSAKSAIPKAITQKNPNLACHPGT